VTEQILYAGDHYLVLGRVTAFAAEAVRRPLVFLKGGLGVFSALGG
jgi:energy-converting hydrogenase Eha subunit E